MKNRKKIAIGAVVVVLCLVVCLVFLLVHIRADNEKALEAKLNNPGVLFHGVFSTAKDLKDQTDILSSDKICVFYNNENLDYDEKNLHFGDDKKGTVESFNYYYIAQPFSSQDDEATGFKTTMFLCKYDQKDSLILLDQNNTEAGRLSVTTGEADFLGRREVNYFWIKGDQKIPIYKIEDTPYSQGTMYLRSKYYSGKFLTVEGDK